MPQSRRNIPAIGALLESPQGRELVGRFGRELAGHALRTVLASIRESNGADTPGAEAIAAQAAAIAEGIANPSLRPVINATGVMLHTNLGRAPLGLSVLNDIAPLFTGYSNLEFDLTTGKRGHRIDHLRPLLTYLTGAEDALAVNNNAAALILVLHTLCLRGEAVVSRGELIEIGGAFRIPDIMKAGGARMVEVGTTNKTRLSDYAQAITPKTRLLFKAHKSNYAIKGFTEEPSVKELAALARERGLVFVYDMGSGLLRRPSRLPLAEEPDVASALAEGADLVTFSGDKLIGGPQAGIVVGRAELVRKLSRARLMRALRLGKLDIAALSSACRRYLSDETLLRDNPAFAMLEQKPEQIRQRAEAVAAQLKALGIACQVIAGTARTGGGALPDLEMPSFAVALDMPKKQADRVYRALMTGTPAVVAVMREGTLCFDCATVFDTDLAGLAAAVKQASDSSIIHHQSSI